MTTFWWRSFITKYDSPSTVHFISIFVLDVAEMEGWDSHKAIFICRVMEAVKYPEEETSYCFIPKRDFYMSKVLQTTAELRTEVRREAIRNKQHKGALHKAFSYTTVAVKVKLSLQLIYQLFSNSMLCPKYAAYNAKKKDKPTQYM